jgi:hypothetical protein
MDDLRTTNEQVIDLMLVEAVAQALEAAEPSERMLKFFRFKHLPPHLSSLSAWFAEMATRIAVELPPSAERTAGLRKLLEAKDCIVRARLEVGDANV